MSNAKDINFSLSRRSLLIGGVTAGAGVIISKSVFAKTAALTEFPIVEHDIQANGITIHVDEQGSGPAGVPGTAKTSICSSSADRRLTRFGLTLL